MTFGGLSCLKDSAVELVYVVVSVSDVFYVAFVGGIVELELACALVILLGRDVRVQYSPNVQIQKACREAFSGTKSLFWPQPFRHR